MTRTRKTFTRCCRTDEYCSTDAFSRTEFEIPDLRFEISDFTFQILNLTFEISKLKFQV